MQEEMCDRAAVAAKQRPLEAATSGSEPKPLPARALTNEFRAAQTLSICDEIHREARVRGQGRALSPRDEVLEKEGPLGSGKQSP